MYLDGASGPDCENKPKEDYFDIDAQMAANIGFVSSTRQDCTDFCDYEGCEKDCNLFVDRLSKILDKTLSVNITVKDVQILSQNTSIDILNSLADIIPVENPVFDFKDRSSMLSELRIKTENANEHVKIKKAMIVIDDGEKSVTEILIDVFLDDMVENLSIMEFIPKSTANSTDDIKVVSVKPSSEMQVLSKDPLVVWSFADIRNEVIVKYQVDEVDETPKTVSLSDIKEEKEEKKPDVSDDEKIGLNSSQEPEETESDNFVQIIGTIVLIPLVAIVVLYFMRYRRQY